MPGAADRAGGGGRLAAGAGAGGGGASAGGAGSRKRVSAGDEFGAYGGGAAAGGAGGGGSGVSLAGVSDREPSWRGRAGGGALGGDGAERCGVGGARRRGWGYGLAFAPADLPGRRGDRGAGLGSRGIFATVFRKCHGAMPYGPIFDCGREKRAPILLAGPAAPPVKWISRRSCGDPVGNGAGPGKQGGLHA